MADTTRISDRLSQREGHRICPCGSHWWELHEDEPGGIAQVVVSTDGEIVGWVGEFACAQCGLLMEVPGG